MAGVNFNEVALGPGRVLIAAYSSGSVEALPADTVAKGASWGGNWVDFGMTKGITWRHSEERVTVDVDQFGAGVRRFVDKVAEEVELVLAQPTLEFLKYILGHGTLSTSGSTSVLTTTTTPTLTEYTLGVELQAPNDEEKPRRIRLYRCTGMPEVEAVASREDPTVFAAKFEALTHLSSGTGYLSDIRDWTA